MRLWFNFLIDPNTAEFFTHFPVEVKLLATLLKAPEWLKIDLDRFCFCGCAHACCIHSGDFKRRLPRTPSTGTMSSADDLDEREPPSPSDNGKCCFLFRLYNRLQ